MQVRWAETAIVSRYLAPSRVDMILVAGKWRCLLMAGDDDELYEKKPQRYAENNRTAFSCMQR